jgi:hypothetical protein
VAVNPRLSQIEELVMVRFSSRSVVRAAKIGGAGILVLAAVAALNRLAAQQQGPSPYPAGPLVPSGAVVLHDDTPDNTALPANFPDKFAWKLFLEVNRKAEHQSPIGGAVGSPMSHDALWETWADDTQTFPAKPDPANPPQWPTAGQAPNKVKTLAPPLRRRAELLRSMRLRGEAEESQLESVDVGKLPPGGFSVPDGNGVGEEVHRNKVTFDYIVENGLWYREGIAAFFDKAAKAVGNDVDFAARAVSLPRASIEVKANWIVIDEKDKSKFHWNHNQAGQLLGLVAMHIISKDLPNWFWCTFEHVDNPGRGDFIGIHDSFGVDPAHTPSQTKSAGAIYPPEKMKAALLKLFEENGYQGEWADEFKNYRLKGSQVDFTDGPGRPLLLGNSVTESGFVPTASCMTCHARAAVDAGGASSFPFFGQQAPLPLIDHDSLQPVLTYNGPPDPSWYFRDTSNGSTLRNLQTDFIWAIPFKAQSSKKPSKP